MTPFLASLLHAPTPDPLPSPSASPARTTDLAVCALLALVTIGLLVVAV